MQEAVEMMAEEENYIILDVRTESEFASGHIPVSYTHLDVYKRQGRGGLCLLQPPRAVEDRGVTPKTPAGIPGRRLQAVKKPSGRFGGPRPPSCIPNPATCAVDSEALRSKVSLRVSPAALKAQGKRVLAEKAGAAGLFRHADACRDAGRRLL